MSCEVLTSDSSKLPLSQMVSHQPQDMSAHAVAYGVYLLRWHRLHGMVLQVFYQLSDAEAGEAGCPFYLKIAIHYNFLVILWTAHRPRLTGTLLGLVQLSSYICLLVFSNQRFRGL